MAKTIDDTLLPRPPQELDEPARAQATRRAAERLEAEFNLSPEAAEAFTAAAVDPAEIRKAADNPERLSVPGGTVLGLRTRVWTRRVMPDPRNPRVGPARRHPVAVRPGSREDARFRPIPEPDPAADSRPELELRVDSREHLSWAAGIAKKYILKDNDWRLSIRNQGVMTEVWLSAVTLFHEDGTESVTVPVTSEGSSRVIACHDILDIRSADVPYSRDDRAMRSIVRALNDSVAHGPTVEQAEALRCETVPALLLVGFEPHPGSDAGFATAVRSLVALRHVDYPKPWNEAAKMESIADAVLEALADDGLITDEEEQWLAGGLTAEEASDAGFSDDPAVRAARIVRLLTDADPSVHQTIRVAITGQTTKQRITNKFKLQVAAALIMRSVTAGDEREKVTDIYRAFQDGFSDTLASSSWQATYRPTQELVSSALHEVERNEESGANSLELAARSAYPLVTSRQLFSDRGTRNNDQPDRRHPGQVIERMRTTPRGIHQLGQALRDSADGLRVRSVSENGSIIQREDGTGDQAVTDGWLRRTFPPPGRPVSPPAPETAHERLAEALSHFGEAMDGLTQATNRLASVDGVDGHPLLNSEGIDPKDADVWAMELIRIAQQLPVWKSIHVARHGIHPEPAWDDEETEDVEEWEEVSE
jgi:hypothetical protein